MSFTRLVRFIPQGADDDDTTTPLLGEPVDPAVDVGAAVRRGDAVAVNVFSGASVLDPGEPTGREAVIARVLAPLAQHEVGTIRCIGLNYLKHAEEAKMQIPDVPTLFLKPATALADPYPAPTPIPAHTVADDGADYESELAVVLGRAARDVAEADAAACVLGYTAANDVSSRPAQLRTSQWCYAKGFDGSCPLGPVLVAARAVPDVGRLRLRGRKNGTVVQDERLDDLIFSVPKLVSFLSQGTTLPRGTVILTGTPAGVGMARGEYLHDGDEFVVEITPHIGSLVNVFRAEKK